MSKCISLYYVTFKDELPIGLAHKITKGEDLMASIAIAEIEDLSFIQFFVISILIVN